MEVFRSILQIIVAIGIFNVWVLRYKLPSKYRGKEAKTLKEEFEVYGLSQATMVIIGTLKLLAALLLLIGLRFPIFAAIGSGMLTILMAAAVCMHLKVKDPLIKMAPASLMLFLSFLIFILYFIS